MGQFIQGKQHLNPSVFGYIVRDKIYDMQVIISHFNITAAVTEPQILLCLFVPLSTQFYGINGGDTGILKHKSSSTILVVILS